MAVLDLQLPDEDGITLAERLAEAVPGCRALIVTSHGRPGYLKRALASGVSGFLPKTTSAATLADVVRTVHAGGRHVDPELAAEAIAAGDSPLTPREADVLDAAADGRRSTRSRAGCTSRPGRSATTCPAPPPSWAPPTATKRPPSPGGWAGSEATGPVPPEIGVREGVRATATT